MPGIPVRCCFTHFYIMLFPALLMPISRDVGLPLDRVVTISFAMYLLYGFLATPWGYLADRRGQQPVMSVGQLVAGLGVLLSGLLGPAFLLLLALAFSLVGIGCSLACVFPRGRAGSARMVLRAAARERFTWVLPPPWSSMG